MTGLSLALGVCFATMLARSYFRPTVLPLGTQSLVSTNAALWVIPTTYGGVEFYHELGANDAWFWGVVVYQRGSFGLSDWFLLTWRWFARRREAWGKLGVCKICGYDLRATPDRCPECGRIKPNPALLT